MPLRLQLQGAPGQLTFVQASVGGAATCGRTGRAEGSFSVSWGLNSSAFVLLNVNSGTRGSKIKNARWRVLRSIR